MKLRLPVLLAAAVMAAYTYTFTSVSFGATQYRDVSADETAEWLGATWSPSSGVTGTDEWADGNLAEIIARAGGTTLNVASAITLGGVNLTSGTLIAGGAGIINIAQGSQFTVANNANLSLYNVAFNWSTSGGAAPSAAFNVNIGSNASFTLGSTDKPVNAYVSGTDRGMIRFNVTGLGTNSALNIYSVTNDYGGAFCFGTLAGITDIYLKSGQLSTQYQDLVGGTANSSSWLGSAALHLADGTTFLARNVGGSATTFSNTIKISGVAKYRVFGGETSTITGDLIADTGAASAILTKTDAGTLNLAGKINLTALRNEGGTLNISSTDITVSNFTATEGTLNVMSGVTISSAGTIYVGSGTNSNGIFACLRGSNTTIKDVTIYRGTLNVEEGATLNATGSMTLGTSGSTSPNGTANLKGTVVVAGDLRASLGTVNITGNVTAKAVRIGHWQTPAANFDYGGRLFIDGASAYLKAETFRFDERAYGGAQTSFFTMSDGTLELTGTNKDTTFVLGYSVSSLTAKRPGLFTVTGGKILASGVKLMMTREKDSEVLFTGGTINISGLSFVGNNYNRGIFYLGDSVTGQGTGKLVIGADGILGLDGDRVGANYQNSDSAALYLGGGTVSAAANWSSNASTTRKIYLMDSSANGGTIFDTNGYAITINHELADRVVEASGSDPEKIMAGKLIKTGNGTLDLANAASSRTGTTELQQGTLKVATSASLGSGLTMTKGTSLITSSTYTVGQNRVFALNGNTTAATTVTGNMTIDGGTFSLSLDTLRAHSTAQATPILTVEGQLDFGDSFNFQLAGTYLGGGTLDLVGTYTLAATTNGVADLNGVTYVYPNSAFEDDYVMRLYKDGSTLKLAVTENLTLTWNASSGNWSTTDTNWIKGTDTTARPFQDGASVVFGNKPGAGNWTVTMTQAVSPNMIRFENGAGINYTLGQSGAGELIDNGGLKKTGAGELTIDATNANYKGNVTISEGVMRLKKVNALGSSNTITLEGGSLELAAAGALVNATAKIDVKGGSIVYSGTDSNQDISGLIDLSNTANTADITINVADAAHTVAWNDKALNQLGRNIVKSGSGSLQGKLDGALASTIAVSAGKLVLGVSAGSVDLSKISGAGNLQLESANASAIALDNALGLTGGLTLKGGTFGAGTMSGLASISGLTLDGTTLSTASQASYAKNITILGASTFSGTGTYTLTGAVTSAASFTVGNGTTLALAGNYSGITGGIANNGTVSFGNGTDTSALTIALTGLSSSGDYVVNAASGATLSAIVDGTNWTQKGAGLLSITGGNTNGAAPGSLTIESGRTAQLDGTGDWKGTIKGAGTLIVKATGDRALKFAGAVAFEHQGAGKVTLAAGDAAGYTGNITLAATSTATGILDLSNGAYTNKVTIKSGKLLNAENATNLNIKASGNVDMGGIVNTGNIKSLETTTGAIKVAGINNNLTLSHAELMMDESNITLLDPNTGEIIGATPDYVVGFNSDTFTLALGSLDLNVTGPLSAFLQSDRSDYAFRITNGTLGGAITTDFSKIDQNGYLAAIGYRVTGVAGGYVKTSGFAEDSVFRVLVGETKTIIGAGQLEAYRSVFNEGTLNIDFTPAPDADTVYLKEYAGQATGSVLNIKKAGITAIIENGDGAFTFKDENGTEHIGTQNFGNIAGAGNIAKEGEYTHHTGGSINITGFISAREGDWVVKGSAAASSLDVGTDGTDATLELRSNSIISGNTTVGENGSLTLGANFKTGTLDIETGGLVALTNGAIATTETGGTSNLSDGATLTGKGSLLMAEGSTLNVGTGADVSGDIKVVTGQRWTVNTSSALTLTGLNSTAGNGSLNVSNGAVITVASDENANFVGEITGDGNIIKKGTGLQSITVTNDASDVSLDVQQGRLALGGEGATYGALTVGASGAGDPVEALINNNLSVTDLLVHSNGTLSVGSYAASPYVAKSLTVENNAVFDNGATYNTVIPGAVQGGVYVKGTLTLPTGMNVVLHNNVGITTDANGNYPEFIIMTSDGSINWADGSGIAEGTKLYDAVISPGLALFITAADVSRKGNTIVANAKKASRNVLLDYADSNNSLAGANLMWEMGLQSSDTVLAAVEECIMKNIQSGNTGEAKRLMAATAGSTYVSMLSAQQAGFRYQQNLIRNRMTGMGLNQGYQYSDLPYFNAWVQGNGSYDKLDSRGDEAGFDLNSWGGTVGFDVNLTPNLTVGTAFIASYGDLSSSAADSLEGDLDMYYVNLFAQYKYKKWTHALILTGSWGDASVDRTVTYCNGLYRGSAKTDASSYGAMYELTYDIAMNKKASVVLQPLFNASIQKSKMDGFHESGAGNASLSVDNLDATTGSLSVGARVLGLIGSNVFGREAIGEVRAQLVQDVGDSRATGNVGFVGNPNFTQRVRGAKIGTTGVQFGVGLTVPMGEQSSIFAEGNAELRSRSTSANGSVGYRYNF